MIKKNYQHSATLYDQLNYGMAEGLACRLIPKFNEFNSAPNQKVLDIGCGTGALINKLAEVGYWVSGIDPSDSMIAEAKKKYPNLDLIVGSPPQFLRERKFDLILSTNDAINYLAPISLDATISEIANSLTVGGLLYLDFTTDIDFIHNWPNQTLETKIDNWLLRREWTFDPISYTGTETQSWSMLVNPGDCVFTEVHTLYPINPSFLLSQIENCGLKFLSFYDPESMEEPKLDISRYFRIGLLAKKM
jgi:SAM-dependent methyltransferase